MPEPFFSYIKSRYESGAMTAEKVRLYVPARITQEEADQIIAPE